MSSSRSVKVLSWEAMISCDSTKDNNYILYAFYNEKLNVTLSIFNSIKLDLIKTKEFEHFIDNDKKLFYKKPKCFKIKKKKLLKK